MRECWECGRPRLNAAKCETCGAREFIPSAVYFEDAKQTEIVVADVPIVWVRRDNFELGYDMHTRELVGARFPGDMTKR